MRATTKLLLPEDVVVAPLADLPLEPSRRVVHETGDYYVTRAHTRSGSIVVDAQTAVLLEQFRAPSTVIEAIIAFSRANDLDPRRTLDEAFVTLTDLVAARVLVPAESSLAQPIASSLPVGTATEEVTNVDAVTALKDGKVVIDREWETYRYYEIYKNQFTEDECRAIVSLQQSHRMVPSKINYQSGDPIRDCNLFWIPRNDGTDWIFTRLWKLGKQFNGKYEFELSPNMGMAQLTRYMPGQQYNWHMDLGAKESSLRKISIVLQLSSNKDMDGGGTEIFYGDSVDNRIHADIGDVVVFPSFVIHRASIINSGVRWSLVIWLVGPRPLR